MFRSKIIIIDRIYFPHKTRKYLIIFYRTKLRAYILIDIKNNDYNKINIVLEHFYIFFEISQNTHTYTRLNLRIVLFN